ncbi:sel1 repeat family protein, partial [Acinetobacter sp. ANC 5380]
MNFKKKLLSLSLCLFVGTAFAGNFDLKETEKLALKGEDKAQYELGYAYYYGEGVPTNEAKGIEWLKKSAQQGNAKAQYELGMALYDGNIEGSHNHPVAIEWLTKSANQNYADAQGFLGVIYSTDTGKPESYKKGLYYLELAAAQGHADAQFLSGMQYLNGYMGAKRDVQKAYNRPCILELVVISFHYMQIVEFVIDLRLLVCVRDKTYN